MNKRLLENAEVGEETPRVEEMQASAPRPRTPEFSEPLAAGWNTVVVSRGSRVSTRFSRGHGVRLGKDLPFKGLAAGSVVVWVILGPATAYLVEFDVEGGRPASARVEEGDLAPSGQGLAYRPGRSSATGAPRSSPPGACTTERFFRGSIFVQRAKDRPEGRA